MQRRHATAKGSLVEASPTGPHVRNLSGGTSRPPVPLRTPGRGMPAPETATVQRSSFTSADEAEVTDFIRQT